jgi:hypothetical protein
MRQTARRLTIFPIFAIALAMCVSCGDSGKNTSGDSTATAIDSATVVGHLNDTTPTPASPNANEAVHTGMQHVDMHIEPGIVLRIARLRGSVLPTAAHAVPALNDKGSMIIAISSADITVDTLTLTTLLNRHVFGYEGSPLKKLHVGILGGEMTQTGTVHKVIDLPFKIRATVSLTDAGEIRIHPTAVSVLGLGVKGLTGKLGGLGSLIKIEPGHGARLDHDDFILNVEQMLPPPRIRGRLTSIAIVPSGVRQTFGARGDSVTEPERRAGSVAKNYMYFHGGTLAFGKLTMRGTDLEIVDEDESNAFDYDLDRYQEHLVQGRSSSTMVDGLIVHMPDVGKLKARGVAAAPGRVR